MVFQSDVRAALSIASNATTVKHKATCSSLFLAFGAYVNQFGVGAALREVSQREDQLTYMLAFGYSYSLRPGRNQDTVRADTVGKAMAAVGQGLTKLGVPDPRKTGPGPRDFDPLYLSFMAGLRELDGPATRAYPANITIVKGCRRCLDFDHPEWGLTNQLVLDLVVAGFFWLLRPAEYLYSSAEGRSQAFRFCDITLTIRGTIYLAPTAPLHDVNNIRLIDQACLTFTDQKNAVKGEQIGHKANSDPFFCPAKTIGRIVRRLLLSGAPPDTPIYSYYNPHHKHRKWMNATPQYITNALRISAEALQTQTGIDPALLSARSLRPGGATALMCAGISSDYVGLLGRWKSDAMFRYLRTQAASMHMDYAQRMLDHGAYTFAPGTYHQGPQPLPEQTPIALRELLAHSALYDDLDEEVDNLPY